MTNKFRQDDEVIVISGKDKGKKGKILKVFPQDKTVLVDKINIVKKHNKPSQDKKGGIEEIAKPLDWSKVKLICPQTNKPTRVSIVTIDKTKKRKSKVSGEVF